MRLGYQKVLDKFHAIDCDEITIKDGKILAANDGRVGVVLEIKDCFSIVFGLEGGFDVKGIHQQRLRDLRVKAEK